MVKDTNFNLKTIFLIAAVLGLSIRIFNLFLPIWGEEGFFTTHAVETLKNHHFSFELHPPLGQLFYVAAAFFFGPNYISFRLVPFVFSLITILTTFIFAKKMFNLRIAYIAVTLLLLSKLHILSSTYIDLDGAILTTFNLLFMYFMWQSINGDFHSFKKNFIFSNVFLVFSTLTKITGGVVTLPVLIFSFFRNHKTLKITLITVFIAIVFTYIGTIFVQTSISHAASYLTFNLFQKLRFLLLVSWQISAPFSLLLLIVLLTKSKGHNELFLKLWVTVVFLFFFLFSSGGQPDRYISILLPPIFILLACYISRIKLKKYYLSLILGIITIFPLLLLKIVDKIWMFSLFLTIIPYILPVFFSSTLFFKKYKKFFIWVLLFSGIFYNLYFAFFDISRIYSITSAQAIDYYLNNYKGEKIASNVISICFNLETYYNQSCYFSVGLSKGYDDAKTIILINFYRPIEDMLNKARYPLTEEMLKNINENFILVKSFTFLDREYAWFFVKK
jgi:hypothetical protein